MVNRAVISAGIWVGLWDMYWVGEAWIFIAMGAWRSKAVSVRLSLNAGISHTQDIGIMSIPYQDIIGSLVGDS